MSNIKLKLIPYATPVVHPPRRVPVALREPLKEELQRMENLGVIKKCMEHTAWVQSLVIAGRRIAKLECAWILATSIGLSCASIFPCRLLKPLLAECPLPK